MKKSSISKKFSVYTLIILVICSVCLIYIPQVQAETVVSMPIYASENISSITITDETNASYSRTISSFPTTFYYGLWDSLNFSTSDPNFYGWIFYSHPMESDNPYVVSLGSTTSLTVLGSSVSVSIDSPAAGTYDSGVIFEMSANAEGSNLENITWSLNWNYGPIAGGYEDELYTAHVHFNPSGGSYVLTATAYNDVGDFDTEQVSFTIDLGGASYTITPYHDAHSTITPNTVQTVDEGDGKVFTYSADTGYNISSVLVDGVEVGNTGSYTFSDVDANHNISVVSVPKIQYSDISVSDTIANKTVTLSIYCTSGTNNLSQATWKTNSSGAWSDLTPINFTSLTGWANSSITLNSTIGQIIGYQCNITDIVGNFNATAIQTLTTKAYYITASNDTYSLLDPNGQVALCYGANQQFNFSALDGYTIENVIINGTYSASTTSPYNFINVQGNQTIAVSTSEQVWYVNATSDSGCAVDPTGLLMIPAGTNATFTFSPNVGYQLSKLYVNGSETPATNPYIFIPTGNTTLYITSTAISTGLPAGGGGTVITATPTPSLTPEPTDYTFEVDEATKNNIVLSVGVAAIAILIFTVIFARPAKKTVQNYKIEAW